MIEKTKMVVDSWGVIESIEQVSIKKVTPETFWQLYLENNDEFFKLSSSEFRTLACVLHLATYYADNRLKLPGNVFKFDKANLFIMKDKTELCENAIRKAMSSLVKKKMLLKDKNFRGTYYTNPEYFFKGSINKRTKLITQITRYEFEDPEEDEEDS